MSLGLGGVRKLMAMLLFAWMFIASLLLVTSLNSEEKLLRANMNTPTHDHPHARWEIPMHLWVSTQHKLTSDKYSTSILTSYNMKYWVWKSCLSLKKSWQWGEDMVIFSHESSVSLWSILTPPQMWGAACISLFHMIVYGICSCYHFIA